MNTRNCMQMIALGVACGALWGSQSLAGNPVPKVPDGPTLEFTKADMNSDGRISRAESLLVPDLASAFELLDSDQDKVITPAEFSSWSRAAEVELPDSDPVSVPDEDSADPLVL